MSVYVFSETEFSVSLFPSFLLVFNGAYSVEVRHWSKRGLLKPCYTSTMMENQYMDDSFAGVGSPVEIQKEIVLIPPID